MSEAIHFSDTTDQLAAAAYMGFNERSGELGGSWGPKWEYLREDLKEIWLAAAMKHQDARAA